MSKFHGQLTYDVCFNWNDNINCFFPGEIVVLNVAMIKNFYVHLVNENGFMALQARTFYIPSYKAI